MMSALATALAVGDWVTVKDPDQPELQGKQCLIDDLDDLTAVVCINGELTEKACYTVPRALLQVDFSSTESQRLEVLEAVINTGLQAFVEVGKALKEVRDSRLYRRTHSNFEDYCKERWGFGRDYGDRKIRASELVIELSHEIADNCQQFPSTESQARALLQVPNPQRADVWKATLQRNDYQPTAAA